MMEASRWLGSQPPASHRPRTAGMAPHPEPQFSRLYMGCEGIRLSVVGCTWSSHVLGSSGEGRETG